MTLELWLWTIYIFIIGLFLGSFFNVVGIRIPQKESLLGRSKCPSCGKTLGIWELIPVIGYILLQGKCKKCGSTISIRYPIMEFITAIALSFSFVILHDDMLEYIVAAVFISLLVIVTVSDLYYQIVPDSILLIFGVLLLILRILSPLATLIAGLSGSVLAFLFLFVISIYGKKRFDKEALGGGDINLYLIIGLVLGYETVLLSLTFAALLGLLYYALFPKQKEYIPFVPFIAFGSIIVYFYGPLLVNWYLNVLY